MKKYFGLRWHFRKNRKVVSIYKANFVYSLKMKRLSELSVGTRAKIHSFEKDDLFLKLMEMGCVPWRND